MANREAFKKGRNLCLFCGGSPISREHIWSNWADPYLPNSTGHVRHLYTQGVEGDQQLTYKQERQGPAKKRKVPAVCAPCNNGWMSAIEAAAKPILIPLIINRRIILDEAMQTTLVKWALLKLMVIEKLTPADAVFTQQDRTAFYERLKTPDRTYIYIMDCVDGPSINPIFSHSAALFLQDIPENDLTKKNIKSISVSLGYLVIFAIYSSEVDIDLKLGPPFQIMRIYPPSRPQITWPPLLHTKGSVIVQLNEILDGLKNAPGVKIIPPK